MAVQNAMQTSLAAALKKSRLAFTPYTAPTAPPAGTYDPALDSQLGAVQRGLGYTLGGLDTQGQRAEVDYGQQTHDLTTQRDQTLADLLRNHTRADADFTTNSSRLGEDHTTNLDSITRNYQRLGAQQTGADIGAGTATQGGTLAAALKARQANQGLDDDAENRSFGRASTDLNTAHQREGEDFTTANDRTTSYYNDPTYGTLAQSATAYQRGQDDISTQRGQAGIEATQFGLDTTAQKNFQAQQAGYVAPARPSNEFSDAKGSYKLVIRGTRRYRVRPDGSEEYVGTT
jgi:hypothetical protein